ncbi:hypothetical protein Tco_1038014, partial [Tanacetum coccineum]
MWEKIIRHKEEEKEDKEMGVSDRKEKETEREGRARRGAEFVLGEMMKLPARFKRKKGFSVLHPMGWDALWSSSEQYVIQYTHSVALKMGSGDWLKNFISLNKARKQKINKTKHRTAVGLLNEDMAATRIQTAFRAFKMVMKGDYGKRQTSNTLANLQSWIKIQTQIRTRRLAMVEESGIKQKKRENQLRHDAKV